MNRRPPENTPPWINALRDDPAFMRNVTAWQTLPARDSARNAWPTGLIPRLVQAGQSLGIAGLYAHQTQAVEKLLRGENVALATGTASGKTLVYTLPTLNTLLNDPRANALLLFPTKALAHDQIAVFEKWLAALQAKIPLRPYDGDTPQRQRAAIRKEARILVSNPDMLHLGILPHHTRWARFFQGLRYVVLDELHTYRGVFGSHVGNVLRRLRRIANFYGADPIFIAASATIANPRALAEALWESPVNAITQDAAPYGERHVVFYNPPLRNPELGLRASATDEAAKLAVSLLRSEVQSILFARSRLTVELLLRTVRERAARAGVDPQAIQGYRGGYLPRERRAIELSLRSGKTRLVVATNALELGIDIGDLDASVLVGYPGSIAAARQQMGRAGRRAATSFSILIATPSPLDQYLVAHPEYFFGGSPEEARVNPDTLSLLASHLTCAAFELPFIAGETFGQAHNVTELLDVLSSEGLLHKNNARYTWISERYPAQSVSLRTATADNVVVQEIDGGIIGTLDRPSAARMVHSGAIYFHTGTPYYIENLDWERGLALGRTCELSYYTVASASSKVETVNIRRQVKHTQETLNDEEVLVYTKPVAYRRVHISTRETLGWGEIELPEQVLDTEAFRLTLSQTLVDALAQAGVILAPLDYGPDWPTIRRQVLERDQHRCRICGAAAQAERPLEVHHLNPLRTFLAQYTRAVALKLAHAHDNLLSLCPTCHHQVEQARGARTALSGLATLLRNLAPVFLMCDPSDFGSTVEARDAASGLPAIIVYDSASGGIGLTPRLVDLWPQIAQAALERVRDCTCKSGCPSCVGPAGESEPGAKDAARQLLSLILNTT